MTFVHILCENLIKYVDPSGHWVDIVLDVASTGTRIKDGGKYGRKITKKVGKKGDVCYNMNRDKLLPKGTYYFSVIPEGFESVMYCIIQEILYVLVTYIIGKQK